VSFLSAAVAAIPKSVLAEGGELAFQHALNVLASNSGLQAKFKVHDVGDKLHLSMESSTAGLIKYDLAGEEWREYEFGGANYRLEHVVAIYSRPGAQVHLIEDAGGVIHSLPAPGVNGCILRFKMKDGTSPVHPFD